MRPILFHLPGLDMPIYAYGVMLGLAFIAGWYLTFHFTSREGLPYKAVTWTLVLTIVFSLVGARIAHIISNATWDQVRLHGLLRIIFASHCEGLVAYGGFIGGGLAAAAYSKLRKIDYWSLVDCGAPGIALGLGMTRIGCFMAGCCHGVPTDGPLGMVFPDGSQAARVFPDSAASLAHPHSLAVYPTQLFESALGLFFLFPLSLWILRRRKFTGQAFLTLVALYSIGRFSLEMIRGDDDRGMVFDLFSTSQFIALCLLPVVIGLFIYRWKTAPAPPEPLSKEEVEESLIEQGIIKASEAKYGKVEEKSKNNDKGKSVGSRKKKKKGKKK